MKYFYLFFLMSYLIAPLQVYPQEKGYSLSGTVYDQGHLPLAGASISLTGTAFRTVTDRNGRFRLTVPGSSYGMRISYIGFRVRELLVALPLKDSLLVILEPVAAELKEVVVSTGYQELPQERATGSFVHVDKALIDRSVSTDIIDRLKGVVSGLSFNPVGTRISVRGQSTLASNADPLIVVDGFAYNQPVETLNPNDVESISVLKDAAAASIWGSRAGNGVIVITTKKGTYNRPLQLSFNANVQVSWRPDLFAIPAMSSADYIGLEKRLFGEGYYTGTESSDANLALSPVVELLAAERDGKISAAQAQQQIAALQGQDVRKDLSRYFYRPAVNQQYALSLEGGTPVSRYAVSAGYDHNLDNKAGDGLDRITLKALDTWSLFRNKLEFSLGLNLTQTGTDRNSPDQLTWNRGDQIYPYARLADADGSPLPVVHDYRESFVQAAKGKGLLDWNYRPLQDLRAGGDHYRVTDYRVNTGIRYKVLPGLTAQVMYMADRSQTSGRNLQGPDTYFARNLINNYTQVAADGSLSLPIPVGGILDLENGSSLNQDGRAQLDYHTTIARRHELTALAGYEVQSLHVEGNSYRLYGYDADHATAQPIDGRTPFSYYSYPSSVNTIPMNIAASDAADHYRSWYANAAYSYDQRLTVSGSARLDQSNLFGVRTNQKGVPLWSAGIAWNPSRENFYHADWLPYLKLRATFGYNGNINKSLSAYTTASYFDGSASATKLPYAQIINPPNPGLRWERIRNINFGLDFGTRNQRITGTIEYFLKKGLDLIGNTAYPPSSGITTFRGNTANTSGHGLDLNLDTKNLTGALHWGTSFLLSYITDKVTRYDQAVNTVNYLTDGSNGFYPLEGRPLFAVYSYRWAGLDPQTGDPQGYLEGVVSKDYAKILAASTPQTIVYNGPSRPTVFGALRNTFSYKGISLSANITYALGYYFRRNSLRYGYDYGLAQQSGDFARRWQQPGDEARTQVPSIPGAPDSQRDDLYTYSSALVEKGDHIRLQDINFSYAVPRGALPFLGNNSLQVYLYAANLGIIWRANKDHRDPDNPNNYPVPRTIAAGIRLNLNAVK